MTERTEYTPGLASQIDPCGHLIRIGATHIDVRVDPDVAVGWCEIDADGVTARVSAETLESWTKEGLLTEC